MRWFSPITPSPDLDALLECRYVAASAGHHDLLPDGCMDLVWSERLGVVLCGPDTHGWSFDMPEGREIAGVRFRPGAAAAVFAVAACDVVDRRVPLADLFGARTGRELDERLAAAAGAARPHLLEDLVRRRSAPLDPTVALASRVAADPRTGVDALAASAGLSARQLRRRFDRSVGYGPAFLARVSRLQHFAHRAAREPHQGLAELAASAGYVDQAHLAKDTRSITGRTPAHLRASLERSPIAVDVRADGRSVHDRESVDRSPWAA